MKPIILASSSPRRKELLIKHNIDFTIEYDSIKEVLDESLALSVRLEKLAYEKGANIAKKHPEAIVISADTMVCLGEKMLGKANSKEEASQMLHLQSGKLQTVYTAIAIFENQQVHTYCDQTDVWFKTLSDIDIEDYILTREWVGKAGAYAIQGIGNILIDKIEGDKETIIGLPVRIIEEYLSKQVGA